MRVPLPSTLSPANPTCQWTLSGGLARSPPASVTPACSQRPVHPALCELVQPGTPTLPMALAIPDLDFVLLSSELRLHHLKQGKSVIQQALGR